MEMNRRLLQIVTRATTAERRAMIERALDARGIEVHEWKHQDATEFCGDYVIYTLMVPTPVMGYEFGIAAGDVAERSRAWYMVVKALEAYKGVLADSIASLEVPFSTDREEVAMAEKNYDDYCDAVGVILG